MLTSRRMTRKQLVLIVAALFVAQTAWVLTQTAKPPGPGTRISKIDVNDAESPGVRSKLRKIAMLASTAWLGATIPKLCGPTSTLLNPGAACENGAFIR